EQLGQGALLPFPPLWSTFMPLSLHWVNNGQRKGGGIAEDGGKDCRRWLSGDWRITSVDDWPNASLDEWPNASVDDWPNASVDDAGVRSGSPPSRVRAGRASVGSRRWVRT